MHIQLYIHNINNFIIIVNYDYRTTFIDSIMGLIFAANIYNALTSITYVDK